MEALPSRIRIEFMEDGMAHGSMTFRWYTPQRIRLDVAMDCVTSEVKLVSSCQVQEVEHLFICQAVSHDRSHDTTLRHMLTHGPRPWRRGKLASLELELSPLRRARYIDTTRANTRHSFDNTLHTSAVDCQHASEEGEDHG